MSAITAHLDSLRASIFKIPALKKYAELVEEKTKVNVEYFVVGLLGVVALCVFSGFWASSITNLIGFVYPAYCSLVAIETSQKEDDTAWLTYWVVFGLFCLLENFTDYILYWIPFYYAIKLTFLIWAMMPKYQGAKVVYTTVIRPLFLKYESQIDAVLGRIVEPVNAVDAALDASDAAAKAQAAEPETSSS
mmetsp:Transcript_21751/g.44108  ORF Transcript_21751/g.44108 Transcript_21751/m.44108 type:complete len:191 (-) Transcript_21751:188-760(-)